FFEKFTTAKSDMEIANQTIKINSSKGYNILMSRIKSIITKVSSRESFTTFSKSIRKIDSENLIILVSYCQVAAKSLLFEWPFGQKTEY
ncbi:13844_t:CDS:1, partial [Gigaspora margarita]